MKENIYKKLFKLQLEIGSISKDAKNPFYKSKYFDVNSLIKQLHPLLVKYNLVLVQPITDGYVRSVLVDLDGGSIESSLKLTKGLDAQKKGSEITYYRRYTLQSLLALQAVDDDGNLAAKPTGLPRLHLNTPEFKNAQQALMNGKSIQDIKNHYIVRQEVLTELLNFKLNK